MSTFRDALHDFVSRDLAAAAHLAARGDVEAAFGEGIFGMRPPRRRFHSPGMCANPTCGCKEAAADADAERRDLIIADLSEVGDMIGCLNREDDARFSRAIQLALQGDAIAAADLICKAMEREISYRAARMGEDE